MRLWACLEAQVLCVAQCWMGSDVSMHLLPYNGQT